jgi:hypothetical protein
MPISHTLRSLLLVGVLVATAVAAPNATAAPTPLKACMETAAGSTCQSAGNVEITSPRPVFDVHPYGSMPFLLGGH